MWSEHSSTRDSPVRASTIATGMPGGGDGGAVVVVVGNQARPLSGNVYRSTRRNLLRTVCIRRRKVTPLCTPRRFMDPQHLLEIRVLSGYLLLLALF